MAGGADMKDIPEPKPALWLRILQFPLTRLLLLGGVLFLMMGMSNGFMFGVIGLAADSDRRDGGHGGARPRRVCRLFVRFVERRPVSELSLPGMGRELGVGLLVGAGLYTACVLILMVLGIYRIEGLNPVASCCRPWRWR